MNQRGQVLLIVVLVMVVALTVGLSVAARTITTVRTSSEEDSSQRAFSAAEAGIEKSLNNNLAASGSFSNNASFTTTVSQLSGTSLMMNNGTEILKDSSSDVWLSTYPGYTTPWSGNLTFYWGSASDSCSTSELTNTMAALEVVLITGTKVAPVLTHYAWDPCQARSTNNNFSYIVPSSGTVSGKNFAYHVSILVNSGLIARVVSLYAPTKVAVEACDAAHANCSTLPSQGTVITSVGTAGTASRKIVSFKSNPSLPTELFPFILFSPK
jgi:hypothetical protein